MFKLNTYSLCFVTIVMGWLTNFTRGLYSKKKPNTSLYLWSFNFYQHIFSLIAVILIYLSADMLGEMSLFTVLLGCVMGIINIVGLNANLKAYAIGPFSYTSIITALSAIIPTLSGLFFGESISLPQYFGIVLMIICIILSPAKNSSGNENKTTVKWLILSITAAICSGLLGVIQKIHQSSAEHNGEMTALLISCFAVSVVLSGAEYIYELRKAEEVKEYKCSGNIWIIPAVCGIAYAFPNTINLFLVGKIPTVVFFPIVNILPMILLILSAVIIFKEKLSLKRWIGIIIGIVSTVFVSGIIK